MFGINERIAFVVTRQKPCPHCRRRAWRDFKKLKRIRQWLTSLGVNPDSRQQNMLTVLIQHLDNAVGALPQRDRISSDEISPRFQDSAGKFNRAIDGEFHLMIGEILRERCRQGQQDHY